MFDPFDPELDGFRDTWDGFDPESFRVLFLDVRCELCLEPIEFLLPSEGVSSPKHLILT